VNSNIQIKRCPKNPPPLPPRDDEEELHPQQPINFPLPPPLNISDNTFGLKCDDSNIIQTYYETTSSDGEEDIEEYEEGSSTYNISNETTVCDMNDSDDAIYQDSTDSTSSDTTTKDK
jgi:hypothetical protein